ncbi:hypothetical protein [Myxococcus sp. Y35]|uniref:hypothetical protein n=1 Tax=Pseudomyxococcus flavus TaxID=3115648 RepID=UPI003CF83AD0
MGIVTVIIKKSGDLVYDPSNKVRHGDTVRFILDSAEGPSSATVNPPACLVSTASFTLDNTSLAAAKRDDPVADSAAYIPYPFTVDVPTSSKPSHGSELETKNGNLDVTTDPPET